MIPTVQENSVRASEKKCCDRNKAKQSHQMLGNKRTSSHDWEKVVLVMVVGDDDDDDDVMMND